MRAAALAIAFMLAPVAAHAQDAPAAAAGDPTAPKYLEVGGIPGVWLDERAFGECIEDRVQRQHAEDLLVIERRQHVDDVAAYAARVETPAPAVEVPMWQAGNFWAGLAIGLAAGAGGALVTHELGAW